MLQPVRNNRITLVHAGGKGGYVHIPLSILSLAESLIRNGFETRLIDLRVKDLTTADLEGVLYLGVSHMSGSMQIPPALKCAAMAKSMDIPVVFGGAHPSVLPEQTAAHPLVDIAVKGEGEEIVVELAEYFQGNRAIDSVKSIAYKNEDGSVTFTGERKPPPFNKVSHLPYDLLPMEKYLGTNADFGYQSSRGCPHRCAFCAEVALYPKTWRPKPAHVIVTEIEEIIKRFRPERIFFVDSNFFCSKKRVREFCNLVLERSINTKFFGECRFDYFYRYEHEFIDLLKRAGFNEIEFGGESGSDITLADIKKDITSKQILSGIQKCKDTGLKSFTSFMIGFPGESEKERQKTLGIYDQILAIDPNGARINGMFIYSPFPGTELYDRVVKQWGFRPPQSLAEWSKFELYDSSNITWFDAEKKREFQTISTIVRYFFVFKTIMQWSSSQKVKRHSGFFKALLSLVFNGLLYPLAKVRWRFRVFDFGYEWQLWQKAFYSYMGRK